MLDSCGSGLPRPGVTEALRQNGAQYAVTLSRPPAAFTSCGQALFAACSSPRCCADAYAVQSCKRWLAGLAELDRGDVDGVDGTGRVVGVIADSPGWPGRVDPCERSAEAGDLDREDAADPGAACGRPTCGAPMWSWASRWMDEGNDPV